ncbi:MAG: two-component sensor histidine kinase [Litoreibacter sp.]|nr:two-component sensor histidine kinase [Litoreibacter sp.]
MLTPSVQSVLAGVPIPVMVIDANYRVIMTNGPTVELFSNDPLGMNAVTLLRQAAVLAAMDHAVRDGRDSSARFVFSGISGEVTYDFKAHPLLDEAGGISGAVLSFEDHSQMEESELIRRDFIANVSHELRTPLTSLTGFIETLKTSARDDPEARSRFLEIMETEAHRMGRMVRDLLSLSRVEADERVRPRDQVDLSSVVRSVIATLEGKLKNADIAIDTEGVDAVHLVMGDRDQLTQLFLNLIENAIKYGGSGKVIRVSISETPIDRALRLPAVRADVIDQGEGIDPLHLPRLTERFYRIDDHRSREMGGTGLGLAIVKHIVNRHRGRLKIVSQQGEGSTFSVILPAA